MTGNTRQASQNIDAMYPIRFVNWGGRPIIFEYERGVQRNQLTWPQSHGGNFYSEGGFLFTGRMDRHRVEALWPRQLGVDQSDRVTFSDVVRAYMNDEPDQCNVSVKIEQIEVYSGGGGRARLSNVVEIAEGTFVTFPRLNGRTAWWGYSALASEFAIHRRASGMMSVLPWLRYAAQLGAMAAGNVGGEIGEEVGGWIVKIVGRQINRFPVRLARQLTRMRRQIQILIRNGSFVRSRPLIAGMRAFFVGFANGLSSRIVQHISQNRSDRRDVVERLREIQGSVLLGMIEQSVREAASNAIAAAVIEPVFAWVGTELSRERVGREGREIDGTNASTLVPHFYEDNLSGGTFRSPLETEGQLTRRRLHEFLVDKLLSAFRRAGNDIYSALVSVDLAGISAGVQSAMNEPAGTPSGSDRYEAELRTRVAEAIRGIPIIRGMTEGAANRTGQADSLLSDIVRGMLTEYADSI